VKITDFGIARALASLHPGEMTDVVWGSPQYYSPEQAAGESPTPASDVYSIGIVMFEMLAGRPPFVASTQQALAMMHLRDEPPSLSLFNPGVPQALEIIIHKVLAKEPSARYRTADQLGRILISYREQGEGITGTQASATPRATAPAKSPSPTAPTEIAAANHPRARFDAEEPATDLPIGEPARADIYPAEEEEPRFDWVAMALGFVAFVAVAGLIPLWIWVIQVWSNTR